MRIDGHPVDWASMPEWITTEEAANLSGYHPEYIRRLARRGLIGAEKKGRDWWVDRDMLKEYLDAIQALGTQKHDPRGALRTEELGSQPEA